MAPLSIKNPSPFSLWRAKGTTGYDTMDADTPASPAQAYALNLAKLIPGDTIALYTLLRQLPVPDELIGKQIPPFLCCIVLFVFRALATKQDNGKPRWSLVMLSLATFICWVYSQNDWFWTWKADAVGLYVFNAVLLMLAFLAPAFIGKDT
jgi:hypothetical protein